MHMYDCPKFESCNAPICPLDPDWELGSHFDVDKVCYYLTEYSKEAARPLLRGGLAAEHYEAIVRLYPEIIDRHTPIKKQLNRSRNNKARFGVTSEKEV